MAPLPAFPDRIASDSVKTMEIAEVQAFIPFPSYAFKTMRYGIGSL